VGDKETKRQGDKEVKIYHGIISSLLSLSLSPLLLVSLSFCLAGCSHTVTEAEKKAAVDEFFASARSCWPPDGNDGEDADNPRLAVESVASDRNATRVRLVAYSPGEAVDFYLPIYRMSAGRWSVNENGRV